MLPNCWPSGMMIALGICHGAVLWTAPDLTSLKFTNAISLVREMKQICREKTQRTYADERSGIIALVT